MKFAWIFLVIACGGAPVVHTEPARLPALGLSETRPAEGATLIEPMCDASLEERANAIDDDCDRRIDEGSGADGEIVIALAWNGGADLDLVVEPPGEAEAERSASRGACESAASLERAVYAHAIAGEWRVSVVHRDACGDAAGVTATLSASVGDRNAGVINRAIAAGETAPIAVLVIDHSR